MTFVKSSMFMWNTIVMRVENSCSSEVSAASLTKKNKDKGSKRFGNDKVSQKNKKFNHTSCRGCRVTNHKQIDCSFKITKCHICSKIGHIAKVCLSKTKTEVSVIKLRGVLEHRA